MNQGRIRRWLCFMPSSHRRLSANYELLDCLLSVLGAAQSAFGGQRFVLPIKTRRGQEASAF